MRSILFHCRKFDANITGISTRGIEVAPEKVTANTYNHDNGIIVWITVEESDNIENVLPKIKKEIEKFCEETKENRIVLCPFAHLSNKLAPFKKGIEFFDQLEAGFKAENKYEIARVHFGSDKEMLLQLFGHPGNVRYREF
jgi:threonyl-tRNA synthetase